MTKIYPIFAYLKGYELEKTGHPAVSCRVR